VASGRDEVKSLGVDRSENFGIESKALLKTSCDGFGGEFGQIERSKNLLELTEAKNSV
jgi:hypothetical protein